MKFSAVIDAYLDSPKFLDLAGSTQQAYRRYLLWAAAGSLGRTDANEVRPKLIQRFLDGLADTPGAQLGAHVAIKAMEWWAAGPRELLPHPITTGVEVIGTSGGHKPWNDLQVAAAEQHGRPDLARAVILAANTGQRISDLVRMAWTDLEEIDGRLGVNIVQRKTGLQLWIPFTQHLMAAVATWERRPAPLLLKRDGTRWDRGVLAMAWQRERDNNPALACCAGLVFHGLRATACVRLRRLGASEAQISDMVGLSIPMVSRYCRFSVQRENAMAAVHFLDGTNRERTESGNITRKVENT